MLTLTATSQSPRLTLIANELAFEGAGSHFIATGSRYLQMTSVGLGSQRNAGREHLVAQLSRPLEVQCVIEQRLELVRLAAELFHQVLHAITIARQRRFQVINVS